MPETTTRQWWAPTALSAPLEAHLLAANTAPGMRMALCGRTHRRWQELEEFARPDNIPHCGGCLAVVETGAPARPRPVRAGRDGTHPQPSGLVNITPDKRRRATRHLASVLHDLAGEELWLPDQATVSLKYGGQFHELTLTDYQARPASRAQLLAELLTMLGLDPKEARSA